MLALGICVAIIIVMAIAPTREQLAKELAEAHGECGFTRDGYVCTLPKGHAGGHRGEKVERAVPFGKR